MKMGIDWVPAYGKELGSAIEDVEMVISKIKTNKFDENDLLDLARASSELSISAIEEIKNEK
jgi:hypothetical protein